MGGLEEGALVALAPPRLDIDPEAREDAPSDASFPRFVICDDVDPVRGFADPPWDISCCRKLFSGNALGELEVELGLILAAVSFDPRWSVKL